MAGTDRHTLRAAPPGAHGDVAHMQRAMDLAARVRASTAPNPWVGCVLVGADGTVVGEGATSPPGGPHAEAVALGRAGATARGATAYVTLEPCAHHGRTPPCAQALVEAGVSRVVLGVRDPDPLVAGAGEAILRGAGVQVEVGVGARAVTEQLAPYLHHRCHGRPWVVLKLAATLDGRTAAPDGSSRWITGPAARADGHRLRAESGAVLVGAGTVRADDPALTVRDVAAPGGDPLRVVLGDAPADARVHPCWQRRGPLGPVLDELARPGSSSCSSREGPPWQGRSTAPGWSIATCCTWLRRCWAATTASRSCRARARPPWPTPGAVGSSRWRPWVTMCASSSRRRAVC